MVHLYLCLPERCGQKIHKSKEDRQCKIGQDENVCLFCSYVFSVRTDQTDRGIMVNLYLFLSDRCGQKIHKSKGDRQCKIGQKENVCLFCYYVFSVRTGQADRGINAP